MMPLDKLADDHSTSNFKPPISFRDYDCLVDLRSTEYEHWTYNQGIVRQVLEARESRPTRIRTTRSLAGLLQYLGFAASARIEWPQKLGGRLTRLIMREMLSVVEILLAIVMSRRVLVLHAHPLGLFLAWPLLFIFGERFTICLHNDFVVTLREHGREQTIERWLWWCVSRSNRRLKFIAQNKYYARYVRKFMRAKTTIVVWPHPVTPREVYELVASNIKDVLPSHVHAGFFGRVEIGRGISAFKEHVMRHSDQSFIVAGLGALKFPAYVNVHRFERPPTELYCALATRCDSLFIDLRSDVYRIGESGVYWDAVGLDALILTGKLPRMYQVRLRQLSNQRTLHLHLDT